MSSKITPCYGKVLDKITQDRRDHPRMKRGFKLTKTPWSFRGQKRQDNKVTWALSKSHLRVRVRTKGRKKWRHTRIFGRWFLSHLALLYLRIALWTGHTRKSSLVAFGNQTVWRRRLRIFHFYMEQNLTEHIFGTMAWSVKICLVRATLSRNGYLQPSLIFPYLSL